MAETQAGVGEPVDGAHTERTVRELGNDAFTDLMDLVRLQRQLAGLELRRESRTIGTGAIMFAAAGLIGHLVLILASVTLGLGLWALGLPLWLGFLLVTLFYILLAVLLLYVGRRQFQKSQGLPLTRATMGRLVAVLSRSGAEETTVDLPDDRQRA